MSDKKKFNFKEALKELGDIIQVKLSALTPSGGDSTAADMLKNYQTDTGATLKIDKLEVGGKVCLDDGTTPAPAGSVTLSDGTSIVIDTTGAITAVTPAASGGGNSSVDPNAVDPTLSMSAPSMEERVAKLEATVAAMQQTQQPLMPAQMHTQFAEQIGAEKAARLEDGKKTGEALQKMLVIMQQFAEVPAADPVQRPDNKGEAATKKEKAANLIAEASNVANA